MKVDLDLLEEVKTIKPSPRYRDIFFCSTSTEVAKEGVRHCRLGQVQKSSSVLPATHTALHTSETKEGGRQCRLEQV